MEAPDIGQARQIATLAEALLHACTEAAEERESAQREAEALTKRRDALARQLSLLTSHETAAPLLASIVDLGPEALGALEALAPDLQAAAKMIEEVREKHSGLCIGLDDARQSMDWAQVSDLGNKLSITEAEVRTAEQTLSILLEQARSVLPEGKDTDAETGPPDDRGAAIHVTEGAEPAVSTPNDREFPERPALSDEVPVSSGDTPEAPEPPRLGIDRPIEIEPGKDDPPQAVDTSELPPKLATQTTPIPNAGPVDDKGPDHDLDQLLAVYLERDDLVLAWQLAALTEKQGRKPDVPPEPLRALAIGPALTKSADVIGPRVAAFLSSAMESVNVAEKSGDESRADRAKTLTTAALLRPALLDASIARKHLSLLSRKCRIPSLAAIGAAIAELGYDVQPTLTELAELVGVEQRRLPAATSQLREWLDAARKAKTSHQPTYRILHRALEPEGVLGQTVEAALVDAPDSEVRAKTLLDRLSGDRTKQESFVAEQEKASGRPNKDRIHGMALDWFCNRLQEGCDRLSDWLAARATDTAQQSSSNRRLALISAIGRLRKLLEPPGSPMEITGEKLDDAVQHTVRRALNDLIALLEGRSTSTEPRRLEDILRWPLLRLPGGCQPHGPEDPAFDSERLVQEKKLLAALQNPGAIPSTLEQAYEARLREGAILAASELLPQLKLSALAPSALMRRKQALEEALVSGRSTLTDRLERGRLILSTLSNLDLRTPEDVKQRLVRIALIAEALANAGADSDRPILPALNGVRDSQVPPDFPELRDTLDELEAFCQSLKSRIREDQRDRLRSVAAQGLGDQNELKSLEAKIDDLDPITLDDMIALVQAGQPVTASDLTNDDAFSGFFPDFVETLPSESELKRGDILKAIEQRGQAGPLDFSGHDESKAGFARMLVEAWAKSENAFGSSPDRLRRALEELFGLLGFTGVRIEGDRTLTERRLLSAVLRSNVPVAERWFLPPAFGSDARGYYPLLLARREVPDDQLVGQLGQSGRERPCILIVFARRTRHQRERLAQELRQNQQTALVLDEALLLHMATAGESSLRQLFTCGIPFGYLQPYTTNPRSIPPEMFFGRRQEIARITARDAGGCLVYGGRQLGKSALLNHIRQLHELRGPNERALYLDIETIGAVDTPTNAIWPELAQRLNEIGISIGPTRGGAAVCADMRRWLDAEPDRRLLVMLDEADRFLATEAHEGFRNLRLFKDLMESSQWRFKAVFAGLHNVRRMAEAPNSPLVHLGEPICVGPLSDTSENATEARRLVSVPMQAAGYVYDPPQLAWDILARVNHYPSLVQVFCKAVIETAQNATTSRDKGPRWPLRREALFEGRTAESIAIRIRERFQWTLNLDPRYELIALTLAHRRLDHVDGNAQVLRDGLPAADIEALVKPYWPSAIEWLSRRDFHALLMEMVDLGVLGLFGQDRFGLRSVQVAQMLGPQDAIEAQIVEIGDKEPKVDYDAAFFHRRVSPGDKDRRSPFADRVLDDLFDVKKPGLRLVAAAPTLWGADIATRLKTLSESWTEDDRGASTLLHEGPVSSLRRKIDQMRGGQTLVLLLSKGLGSEELDWLGKQSAVKSGKLLPVVVVEPQWLADETKRHGSLPSRLFSPRPWGDGMLRLWLEEQGLATLDERRCRAAILAGTGGTPERLAAAREILTSLVTATPYERQERLETWSKAQRITVQDAGLDTASAEAFMSLVSLCNEGETTLEEAAGVLEQDLGLEIELFVALGLATLSKAGGHVLTPLGRLVAM